MFKVGDKVVHTRDIKVYTIREVLDFSYRFEGHQGAWLAKQFKLAKTPRPHAEMIKQWADDDSLKVEWQPKGGTGWTTVDPSWNPHGQYRFKKDNLETLEKIEELEVKLRELKESL